MGFIGLRTIDKVEREIGDKVISYASVGRAPLAAFRLINTLLVNIVEAHFDGVVQRLLHAVDDRGDDRLFYHTWM